MTRRLGVLASGNGSNAMAIAEAARAGRLGGELACILVDRPGAPVIDKAVAAGVDAVLVDRAAFDCRDTHERAIVEQLVHRDVDAVVLAGYMRICGSVFLDAYEECTLNVHPSLLPMFLGRDPLGDAIAAGVDQTGVTIHFIDTGVDTGPIVCQAAVPIRAGESRDALAQRVHAVEHRLLPIAAAGLLDGRLVLRDGTVVVDPDLRDELAAAGALVPHHHLDLPEAPQPCSVH